MNPVLVGTDPKQDGLEPFDPLYPSGRRLAQLMGLPPQVFRLRTDRVNLHAGMQDQTTDSHAARNLLPLLRGRRVVLLGNQVAQAFGVEPDWFQWSRHPEGFVVSVAPHPSARSTWWNSKANVQRASDYFLALARPCVHIEGPDGAGKSTLTRKLGEALFLDSVPTDDPPSSWEECLGRVDRRIPSGLVCDRSSGLVSELVYGPVLRGGTIADESEVWKVVRSVLHAVTFVYCRPPTKLLAPKFRLTEDEKHVEGVSNNLSQLADRYDLVMNRIAREGGRVFWYDWTHQNPEEVIQCVA